MNDAAIANVVTGLVTITTLVVGFLTLWVKLRYGAEQAEKAARKADVVERKIDYNTTKTEGIARAVNGGAHARAAGAGPATTYRCEAVFDNPGSYVAVLKSQGDVIRLDCPPHEFGPFRPDAFYEIIVREVGSK